MAKRQLVANDIQGIITTLKDDDVDDLLSLTRRRELSNAAEQLGMLSRMREWKPIKPKLLQLLLEAYSGKTLEDGTDVLFKYCGLTKFSTRRASEYVIFAHREFMTLGRIATSVWR